MLKNSTIYLIRHGEKPDSEKDIGLSTQGKSRANAYVPIITAQNAGSNSSAIDYIFATQNSKRSVRPFKTIQPLAKRLKKKVKQHFADTEYEKLADFLKKSSKYNNKNVLICWHHGQLIHLTKSLGVPKEQLPLTWPEDVFGWLLKIQYDKKGAVKEFTITNVKLMYNDVDKDPDTIIKKQLADFKTSQNSHEGISENSLPKPFYEGGEKKAKTKKTKKTDSKNISKPLAK